MMFPRWLAVVLLFVVGCDRREAPPPPVASAARAAAASASAAPAYRPHTKHKLRATESIELALPHRVVPIFVRVAYPADAQGRVPTVLWSHGGGATKGPNPRGREWVELLVKAGFAVVKLSHTLPDLKQAQARCEARRVTGPSGPLAIEDCEAFLKAYAAYLKPMDIRHVLDQLPAVEAEVETQKGVALRFDRDRLAVAGHSGGCAATLAVAGATRRVGDLEVDFGHPAPKAFACMSPAGVGDVGWSEGSFAGVDRPLLLATGSRDEKDGVGKDWASRARLFDLVPGQAFTARLFLDHPRATHGAFNLAKASRLLHPTLKRAMVAFLDATVRTSPPARAYVESPAIAELWQRAKPGPRATEGAPPTWCWKEKDREGCHP